MNRDSDRSILTWWDLAGLAFQTSWRYMVAVLVVIGATAMWIHHTDRDVKRDQTIAQLQAQVAACQGIKDLAAAIDDTPSGSRTAAGSLLAGR